MYQKIKKSKRGNYIINNWSNSPVWESLSKIKMFLENNLTDDNYHYLDVLAEPKPSHSDFMDWYTIVFESKPETLSSLKGDAYAKYKDILDETLQFFYDLIHANNTSEEWKELLSSAISIPNEDSVYCAEDKVVFTNWGARKKRVVEDSTLSLKTKPKKRKNTIIPPVVPIEESDNIPNDEPSQEVENLHESELSHENFHNQELEPITQEPVFENEEDNTNENNSFEEEEKYREDNDPEKESPNEEESNSEQGNGRKKKSFFSKFWKMLLALLLILLLILLASSLLKQCGTGNKIPPKPGIIKPIPPEDFEPGKDSLNIVVSNRLNILIKDEGMVKDFMKDFIKVYPSENYKIVYYNDEVQRVQIQVPKEEKETIRKELPGKMSQYNIVIWDEILFENDFKPSDPAFGDHEKSWYFECIRAYGGWEKTMGDKAVKVAVVDDGFDLNHPELKGKVIDQYNSVTRKHKVTSTDDGHGTHVASTAVGFSDNGEGNSGIAPQCDLVAIQVADDNDIMTSTAIIDGILYAIFNDADVVNLSLGRKFSPLVQMMPVGMQMNLIQSKGKEEEEVWNQIFALAVQEGCTIVLAGGNENILIGLDPMQRSSHTIKVSAVEPNFTKASFSNYGYYSTISAPGVHIYNAFPDDKYKYMDGTSMAAPIVTGGIALIKSLHPDYTTGQIAELLRETGLPAKSPDIAPIIQLERVLGVTVNAPPDKIPDPNEGLPPTEPLYPGTPDYPGGPIKVLPDKPSNPIFPELPANPNYPNMPNVPGYPSEPIPEPTPNPLPVPMPEPKNPCPDVQNRIDSLQRIIDQLRKQCGADIDTLKITPETTLNDLAGMWKSTSPLYSTSGEAVELFFDINKSGKGNIYYNQRNGKSFEAPISITLSNSVMHIQQRSDAISSQYNGGFRIHYFDCTPHIKTAIADGEGYEPQKKHLKIVKFNLIKIK